jgi:hypothetical protein
MIRGTNTQFNFILPCAVADIATAQITFWQDGYFGPASDRPLPIVKVLGQCDLTDNPRELCITLNQEETLRFSEDRKAYVQLKAVTSGDATVAYASKKRVITVYPVYDDNILDDDIIPTPDFDGLIILNGGFIE